MLPACVMTPAQGLVDAAVWRPPTPRSGWQLFCEQGQGGGKNDRKTLAEQWRVLGEVNHPHQLQEGDTLPEDTPSMMAQVGQSSWNELASTEGDRYHAFTACE